MSDRPAANPFPGVNPYVEWEGYWEDFHGRLIITLSEVILDQLPPRYDARVEERMLVLKPDDKEQRRPDIAITDRGSQQGSNVRTASAASASSGASAVLEMLPFSVREERQTWIEILDDQESAVTSIEVLSPSNKDGRGDDLFHGKRMNLLLAGIHHVDIDLLLSGERFEYRQPLPPGHFYAFVTRAERRPRASEVYAWTLREPLPHIAIPLRQPDPDIRVDLGEAYRLAFERGRYPRRLRYAKPASPLAAADEAWVRETAASAARRGGS